MSLYKSSYELKVSFEDLDLMGIVWHGNYMRYMEQARCDMFEKLNYTYMDMKNDGIAYPVAKMKVKYIKPVELGDVLKVETEIISIEPALNIKYVIYDKKTSSKIFSAETMQIAVDIQERKSVYNPPLGLIKALEHCKGQK